MRSRGAWCAVQPVELHASRDKAVIGRYGRESSQWTCCGCRHVVLTCRAVPPRSAAPSAHAPSLTSSPPPHSIGTEERPSSMDARLSFRGACSGRGAADVAGAAAGMNAAAGAAASNISMRHPIAPKEARGQAANWFSSVEQQTVVWYDARLDTVRRFQPVDASAQWPQF